MGAFERDPLGESPCFLLPLDHDPYTSSTTAVIKGEQICGVKGVGFLTSGVY